MFIDKSFKRSVQYVGTFSTSQDVLEIQDLKYMVKKLNQDLKDLGFSEYQFYVKLRARGKELLSQAKQVDAYIYRR